MPPRVRSERISRIHRHKFKADVKASGRPSVATLTRDYCAQCGETTLHIGRSCIHCSNLPKKRGPKPKATRPDTRSSAAPPRAQVARLTPVSDALLEAHFARD